MFFSRVCNSWKHLHRGGYTFNSKQTIQLKFHSHYIWRYHRPADTKHYNLSSCNASKFFYFHLLQFLSPVAFYNTVRSPHKTGLACYSYKKMYAPKRLRICKFWGINFHKYEHIKQILHNTMSVCFPPPTNTRVCLKHCRSYAVSNTSSTITSTFYVTKPLHFMHRWSDLGLCWTYINEIHHIILGVDLPVQSSFKSTDPEDEQCQPENKYGLHIMH